MSQRGFLLPFVFSVIFGNMLYVHDTKERMIFFSCHGENKKNKKNRKKGTKNIKKENKKGDLSVYKCLLFFALNRQSP